MSKKSKPTKKDQALEEYISYLKDNGLLKKSYTSFEDKINQMVEESLKPINSKSALEVIEKCGKGPSTGYVDGVQYKKDYQRVTDGKAKVGELEQKHLDYQESNTKVAETKYEKDRAKALAKCMEFPEDMVGMGLDDFAYQTPNIDEPDDPEFGGGSYGWRGGYERDTGASWSELEDAFGDFESEMDKALPLQDNVMLFTHDIPNPELEVGDVFELDTYMGVNFQKKMVGQYDDMWDNVDIPEIRRTNGGGYMGASAYYDDGEAYDVTVLGSEGTPLLLTDPYEQGAYVKTHTGVLQKGQKVRLVGVNHEKHTAIYQTVEG